MLSVEDKIEIIEQMLRQSIYKNNEYEMKKLKENKDEKIAAFKEQKKNQTEERKRELEIKYKVQSEKITSKTLTQGQNILLEKTQEIKKDFDKALKNHIKKEYTGKKGEIFLKKSLDNIDKDKLKDVVFLVGKEFEQRDKKIIKENIQNAIVETTPNIKLGGFVIDNNEKTVRINCSVDFALRNKEEQINKLLKEQL